LDYFWGYFDRFSGWDLEAREPISSSWQNVTEHLIIDKARSEDNQFEKISLEFTAPFTADYRLTYTIDKPLKSYINRSEEYIYELNYSVGNNEEYTTYFDFSDIASISGVIINHGIVNIDGEDKFWFSVQRDNIPEGTYILLDPIFGNSGTSTSDRDGDDIPGGLFQMGGTGGTADNITALFNISYDDNYGLTCNITCALYEYIDYSSNYMGDLIAVCENVTFQPSDGDINQDMWLVFNFTEPKPSIEDGTNYYFAFISSPAKSGWTPLLRMNTSNPSHLIQHNTILSSWPDPYIGESSFANRRAIAYCCFTET